MRTIRRAPFIALLTFIFATLPLAGKSGEWEIRAWLRDYEGEIIIVIY
jgi:hypothetical protein